jgi:hypothetical protein
MQISIKTVLHIIGSLLGLGGVVFVVIRLAAYTEEIDLSQFGVTVWSLLCLLALTYGSASFFLVKAWQQILIYFKVDVANRWALKTYGTSQIAKYVPGNVFHLAGRQALGMAIGLPGPSLAKSVIWEQVLFASTGTFYGVLGWTMLRLGMKDAVLVALFILIALAMIAALRYIWSAQIANAFTWQLAFLLISSGVFVTIAAYCAPFSMNLSLLASLATAYIIAWVAGFITPGAPAGMGIRELVLLFLLKGMISESDLLLAVVLGRIVTVLGDLLFFLLTFLVTRSEHQAS